ncbi:hypothetical protein D3C83_150640 [compost metagenome]
MARGSSNGMARLARFLPTMLRATVSGLVDAVTVSAIVTIHVGPSATILLIRGRVSLRRIVATPSFARSNSTSRTPLSLSA